MLEALGNFDSQPAAEKSTDDSLAARKEEVSPSYLRDRDLFEETKKTGAQESAEGCGSDDEPAIIVGKKIASAVT